MPDHLTNLLPPERRRAIRRDYFLRFGTVVALFATVLIIAAAALLAPTYVFLARSVAAKEARLASMRSALSSPDDVALSARLAALKSDADALAALAGAPSASAIVRAALAVSRPGVALSGFEYAPATEARPGTPGTKSDVVLGTLAVSGTASTRDALRGYQLALERATFARSADLPVSTYAKDRNIPFTITVTLAP